MATAELLDTTPDIGQMAANGMVVRMLQTALSRAETNAESIPSLMRNLIRAKAWQDFVFADAPDDVHHWNTADFRAFIEGDRPSGCQTQIPLVRRMLAGTDLEVKFEEMIRGEQGPPHGNKNAAKPIFTIVMPDATETNRNNITDCFEADAPRVRDYSRESKQGNSVGYALRRLEKNRPDLLEQVKAGDMTPHRAMVAAGFAEKSVTVPTDPEKAARRLARHFRGESMRRLINALESTMYDDTLDAEE